MKPLTPEHIRGSMINASASDVARLTVPGLHETVWDEREFLGWRDLNGSLRGYISLWIDDRPVTVQVRAASSTLRPGIGAMCSLCHTPQPSTQVLMFSAARGGEAGREGNSIGTYICADLACSIMIRMIPENSELRLSRSDVIARRSDALRRRVEAFCSQILSTA